MKRKNILMLATIISLLLGNVVHGENYDERYDREYFDILSKVLKENSSSLEPIRAKTDQLRGLEDYLESNDLVRYASLELGKPYYYGASGPDSFDCSGLMVYIFEKTGKKIPRTSAEQAKEGMIVTKEELRTGDLVFFDTRFEGARRKEEEKKTNDEIADIFGSLPSLTDTVNSQSIGFIPEKVTHVGIYVGEDRFIHASSEKNNGVVVDSLSSKYYKSRYLFAKRY